MTPAIAAKRPGLARRISIQVGVIVLITSILQMAVVIAHNYFDYDDLSVDHVRRETQWLLSGLSVGPEGFSFELPASAQHYRNKHRKRYAYRVLDSAGRVIAAEQPALLEKVSPWRVSGAEIPSFWFRKLDDTQRFYFAGGKRFRVGAEEVLIEMATLGDPAGVHWWIVAHETLEDVWLPILPFTLLIPLLTLFAVRRALNFLTRAARQAEAIDPGNPTQRVDLAGIPREATAFAVAINRLLERVSDLIRSRQIFTASAAHQLRTPLAAMMLELEKISDERARGIEKDVGAMAETVDRLLTFVRLQAREAPDFVDFNIGTVVEDAVRGLRTWSAAHHHDIEMLAQEPGNLLGDPVAVREALVNLVENAVKHTPQGTAIRVTAGPGCSAAVEDSGPGLPAGSSEHLFRPFERGNGSVEGTGLGLAIVRQAVDLHGGSVEVSRSRLGGAMFRLRFG